jgi:hypothetical protein
MISRSRIGFSAVWTSIHPRVSILILRSLTRSFVAWRESERAREREREIEWGEGGGKGPAIVTILKGHLSRCVKMFTATNAPGILPRTCRRPTSCSSSALSSCFVTVVQLRRLIHSEFCFAGNREPFHLAISRRISRVSKIWLRSQSCSTARGSFSMNADKQNARELWIARMSRRWFIERPS